MAHGLALRGSELETAPGQLHFVVLSVLAYLPEVAVFLPLMLFYCSRGARPRLAVDDPMTMHDISTSTYPVGILSDHCMHRVLMSAGGSKARRGDRRILAEAGALERRHVARPIRLSSLASCRARSSLWRPTVRPSASLLVCRSMTCQPGPATPTCVPAVAK